MLIRDLEYATENKWGSGIKVFKTKVKGIYDTTTARHGGYLVDINLHPELSKYGAKTNIPNLRAFEEDYEALKVLWVYPQLINNIKEAKSWLTPESVIRYDDNNNFLKDFPERKTLDEHEEEEEL